MNNFVYDTPTRVYFGKNEEQKVGKIVSGFHPAKVLLHYGGKSAKKSGLLDRVKNCLAEEGISFCELGGVKPNPELELVREGISLCVREGVDFILAVGGGSVLDSAKDIANGVANPEVDVWDFSLGKRVPEKTLRFRNVELLCDNKLRNERKKRIRLFLQQDGLCDRESGTDVHGQSVSDRMRCRGHCYAYHREIFLPGG